MVVPVLAKIPEASVLEIYAQQAAGRLRIEPEALLRDVRALKTGAATLSSPRGGGRFAGGRGDLLKNRARVPVSSPLPGPPDKGGGTYRTSGSSGASKDESYLLGLLIERPDLLPEVAPDLRNLSFSSQGYERVFARLQRMVEADATVIPIERLSEFETDEQGLITAVAMTRYPELDSGSEAALRQSLEQCLQTLKINAAQRRLKALVAEMRAAHASGDESRLVTLMQENDRLARELDSLKAVRYGPS